MEIQYQYDQELLNKSGQREGELIHTYYDETVEYKHLYKEGLLIEAKQYRFSVEGLRPLIGKYKEGKPFDGYFVYRNEFKIPLIDYYQEGLFLAQYTCSLLDLMSYEGREFNLKFTKTTFQNNKPQDGLVHSDDIRLGDAHLVASEYYKDGKISNVDFWIMAMHYAELIKLQFLPNGYKIYKEVMPNVQDPVIDNKYRSITVEFKNPKSGSVLFEVENKLITQYEFSYTEISQKTNPSDRFILYFIFKDNNIIKAQHHTLETNEKLYNDAYGPNPNIISQVFLMMNNQPIPHFSNEGNNDYSHILALDERINTNVILYLDKQGNPFRGFLIEQEQSGKYKYTQYKDSKVISQKEGLNLDVMTKLILKAEKEYNKEFQIK